MSSNNQGLHIRVNQDTSGSPILDNNTVALDLGLYDSEGTVVSDENYVYGNKDGRLTLEEYLENKSGGKQVDDLETEQLKSMIEQYGIGVKSISSNSGGVFNPQNNYYDGLTLEYAVQDIRETMNNIVFNEQGGLSDGHKQEIASLQASRNNSGLTAREIANIDRNISNLQEIGRSNCRNAQNKLKGLIKGDSSSLTYVDADEKSVSSQFWGLKKLVDYINDLDTLADLAKDEHEFVAQMLHFDNLVKEFSTEFSGLGYANELNILNTLYDKFCSFVKEKQDELFMYAILDPNKMMRDIAKQSLFEKDEEE